MFDRKISDMHAWVEERLSGYIDSQIAADERAQIERHLADCARCRASLESLRWTVSLLKQAPAPALPRSFAIPIVRRESRAGNFSFGFLRAATALATLLLCLVVGLDLFSQSRFSSPAPSAPLPAAQFAAPTQNVALAPQATAAPTSAPAPTLAPPQPLSQPLVLPTATRAFSVGAAEALATRVQADNALKSAATAPAAPPAPRAAITATITLPSPAPTQPAPTQTVPSATNTPEAVARSQPTRETAPSADETFRERFSTSRTLELGLLALVIMFGALTFVAWRRS